MTLPLHFLMGTFKENPYTYTEKFDGIQEVNRNFNVLNLNQFFYRVICQFYLKFSTINKYPHYDTAECYENAIDILYK